MKKRFLCVFFLVLLSVWDYNSGRKKIWTPLQFYSIPIIVMKCLPEEFLVCFNRFGCIRGTQINGNECVNKGKERKLNSCSSCTLDVLQGRHLAETPSCDQTVNVQHVAKCWRLHKNRLHLETLDWFSTQDSTSQIPVQKLFPHHFLATVTYSQLTMTAVRSHNLTARLKSPNSEFVFSKKKTKKEKTTW